MRPEHNQYLSGISVFIATPAYKGIVSKEYAGSLFGAGVHLTQHNIPVCSAILENAAFIEQARNVLLAEFLKTKCSHLFFIDADIGWPAETVFQFVTSNLDVCAGVCPQRDGTGFKAVPNPNKIEKDGWVHFARVGTGFLCVERETAKQAADSAKTVNGLPWVFETEILHGDLIGEDYVFCDKVGGAWVWPDITFTHDQVRGNLSENWRLHDTGDGDEVCNDVPDSERTEARA